MCKTDYLGTGICRSGTERSFNAYYPQGRMDILAALIRGEIPYTDELKRIADDCDLCGICDLQCHFSTGLRPLPVMKKLKTMVSVHLQSGGAFIKSGHSVLAEKLAEIVGDTNVSSDPAVLICYSHDPFPLSPRTMPQAVVLPLTTEETSLIIRLLNELAVPFALRGNGSSVIGAVMTDGVVIDFNRMKSISIDPKRFTAKIGAGVTSFELQREAVKYNLRANTAETSACVCANINCSGLFSNFSASYGTCSDNFTDCVFLDRRGNIHSTNSRQSPNIYAWQREVDGVEYICTEATVRLHRRGEEEALLIPFEKLADAMNFTSLISKARKGTAIGLLGLEYVASFLSPDLSIVKKVRSILHENLRMGFMVLFIGDAHDARYVKENAVCVIEQELFSVIALSLSSIAENRWMNIIRDYEGNRPPYEFIFRKEMIPVLKSILGPSPESVVSAVPEDLKAEYLSIYNRKSITDLIFLSEFRILSPRLGREKHVTAFIIYAPLDNSDIIIELLDRLEKTAASHDIKNEFGFITPLDDGKFCVIEYDYFLDQTDADEITRIQQAMAESMAVIESYSNSESGIKWIKDILSQGFCRKEAFFYT
jgi:hypothetical protein